MFREPAADLRRTGNPLLSGILIVAVLYFAREVFVPLALAGLMAFVLTPAAVRLERLGMKRTPAALLVILLTLAVVAVLASVLLGQIYSLAVEIPQYQQNITEKIGSLHLDSAGKLSSTIEMLNGLNKRIRSDTPSTPAPLPVLRIPRTPKHTRPIPSPVPGPVAGNPSEPVAVRIEAPEESMMDLAERSLTPLLHPLATTFIVGIFLVFMLIGREDLRDRGLKLAGSERMHVTTSAIKDATMRVTRYLQMQLIVNLSYGAVAGLALFFIGVPHPLLWAVLTCVLRFIPYVGIMMAAAGPLLLAGAASPRWGELICTVVTFGALEIVAANFVEPMLYGASTGISALAVLIAAVFWTFLWGLPGLLLSTPLTVCLIVIGRQVPRLRYLEVLFGERTGLPPSEHFYQRMLASNVRDARAMIHTKLKTQSLTEVFDTVIVPALAMIEVARNSEEMTAARAEEILQSVEELVEDLSIETTASVEAKQAPPVTGTVMCVPARDFADEIACLLAQQVMEGTAPLRVIPANASISSVQQLMAGVLPGVICVVGVPPRAMRYTKMRCHQMRVRYPESVIVACILGDEQDLSTLRSRVPIEDAQHVVSSLQLLSDYLKSVLHPALETPPSTAEAESATGNMRELGDQTADLQQMDAFDGPQEGLFNRLAANVARSFDAPIALITSADAARHFWEAQCGLAEDSFSANGSQRDCSICSTLAVTDAISVVPDTAEDKRFADDLFLKEHGIRFCAVAALQDHGGNVVGSLCVLDTRPRQITEKQRDSLISFAESVMTAIEMSEQMSEDEALSTNRGGRTEIEQVTNVP